MTVLKFPALPDEAPQGWQPTEMQKVIGACAASVSSGEASGWEIGSTEAGDPQLYLLGPPPDHDCILCISRLGHRYVLEDGNGNVFFEQDSLLLLAEQMRAALRRRTSAIVARLAIAWCAIREAFEEKMEPVLAEPAELLTHVAPQLAALA